MSDFWDGFEKQAAKLPKGWSVIEGGKHVAKSPKSLMPKKNPKIMTDKERVIAKREGRLGGKKGWVTPALIAGGMAYTGALGHAIGRQKGREDERYARTKE